MRKLAVIGHAIVAASFIAAGFAALVRWEPVGEGVEESETSSAGTPSPG